MIYDEVGCLSDLSKILVTDNLFDNVGTGNAKLMVSLVKDTLYP